MKTGDLHRAVLMAGALFSTGCGKSCSKTEVGMNAKGSLEATFQTLKVGAAFGHSEVLDLDWAQTTSWSVVTVSSAQSSSPMANGSTACRAYGFFLRGGEDTTPWAAVAVFCDGHGLVRSDSTRATTTILTWPVMADVVKSKLELELRFVDALGADHQILWVREKSWGDGYLCAMEYAYVLANNKLMKILQAVGADPAAYSDYNAGDEVNAKQAAAVSKSYEAEFFGDAYPRRFRASHISRGQPFETIYEFVDGAYKWLPPPHLREHFR